MAENNTQIDSEMDVFIESAEQKFITDLNGNEVPIPKKSARLELQVANILTKHVKALKEMDWSESAFDFNDVTPSGIISILPNIANVVPDLISELSAVILGRNKKTILDDFDLQTLIELITPFLSNIIEMIRMIISSNGKIAQMNSQ